MRNFLAVLGAAAALISFPAQAGYAGHDVRLSYLFPDVGTTQDAVQFTAPWANIPYEPESTEFTPNTTIFISVLDDTIIVTGERSQVFADGAFNGLSVFDVLGTIDAITGVSLIESTLPGVDASDVFFDADTVRLNFAAADGSNLVDWRVEQRLQFDNGGGGQVPVPATLALAPLALGLLAATRRRRA